MPGACYIETNAHIHLSNRGPLPVTHCTLIWELRVYIFEEKISVFARYQISIIWKFLNFSTTDIKITSVMRGSAQRVTGRTWNHSSGRCTSRLKSSSTWPRLSWSKPCKTSPETSVTSTATWWYWSFSGQATNSIFFVSFFVQKHWFAWRSNQWSLVGRKHFHSSQ